jgi:hypothetical protein
MYIITFASNTFHVLIIKSSGMTRDKGKRFGFKYVPIHTKRTLSAKARTQRPKTSKREGKNLEPK